MSRIVRVPDGVRVAFVSEQIIDELDGGKSAPVQFSFRRSGLYEVEIEVHHYPQELNENN